ncbi:non-ribosomal peptide synthetase, partial [Mesorhizobium sp. dw_380]|uniref:non-ribosomal peptide synthetase n=1 Tax=Mesorhizobium sp. dw_380 TaxID=2812001 RepID=UPI001BDE6F1B
SHHRFDLTQAPLLRFVMARDPGSDRWLLLEVHHHLIGDHSTLDILNEEIEAILGGREDELPAAGPFRNVVAQARLGVSEAEHERYFRERLGDVDEPVLPFGLAEVRGDGKGMAEIHRMLPQPLNDRLRSHARRLGVSLASLCHVAWGQVVARTSGREKVVFGTVLLGRMQASAGADRAMGLFINTLPLRLDLDGRGVAAGVRDAHLRLAELLQHEHAPLVLAQRCSGVAAGTPLFSALLNYRHNAAQTASLSGAEWLESEERTNYPLTLSVEDFGTELGLTAQVVEAASADRVIGMMQRVLESLVEALDEAPETPLRSLDVLPAEERELVLETWNRTEAAYPSDRCIHELFEEQVARTPDAVALVQGDKELTYGALNAEANRLAHRLIGLGVKPDDRVGLCVERSPAMVIGLLGVLKAGGAYVPLDPGYPRERLGWLVSDADPRLVLVDKTGRAALGEALSGRMSIGLDEQSAEQDNQPANDPDPRALGLTPRHLAYVIYTSGSTGMPKGAQNEHRAIVNRLVWMQDAYRLDANDVVLQKTPYSFDVSGWEFFWTLLTGARLVLAAPEEHKDPSAMVEAITRHRVTTIHFVPSMLASFLEAEGVARCTSLQRIVCSGEALPALSVHKAQRLLPQAKLHNLYGPTEAAIDVTAWTCPAGYDGNIVPIGRPISNTQMYILDGYGEPVPLGVAGELYIGGVGVARGYLNRAELTAERFVADRFSSDPQARLYRTGDLARYLQDGNIEYLGRNDHQVKIRGFRIELGEIETRLGEHALVREAVVIAREDTPGDKRLVAYVVTRGEADADLAAMLRTYLGGLLPEYMVPAAYVVVEALPLSANGKLDRRALPAPEGGAYARGAYEPPRGEVEAILAGLWAELLGGERVGRQDSFFELGGHSLLAVKLLERLRRLGLGA